MGKAGWVDAARSPPPLPPTPPPSPHHPHPCTPGNTPAMFIFARGRRRGPPASVQSVRFPACRGICAGVVSTRNNTLPWDLLNGRHLSLSAEASGKAGLRRVASRHSETTSVVTVAEVRQSHGAKKWKGSVEKMIIKGVGVKSERWPC